MRKRQKKGKTEDRTKIKESSVKQLLEAEQEKWRVCLESLINQMFMFLGLKEHQTGWGKKSLREQRNPA